MTAEDKLRKAGGDRARYRDGAGSGKRRAPAKATQKHLENAALYYLQRYASSAENLRQVLMRRVLRSARFHGTDEAEGPATVERIVRRFVDAGLLDDRLYAEGLVRSLHRRGASRRMIQARLGRKGVDAETAAAALADLDADAPDPDFVAAVAHARRRRLGPYRTGEARPDREMASLARAGFSFDLARLVVNAGSVAELEERLAETLG